MPPPYLNPALDTLQVSIDWPIDGAPTIAWTPPAQMPDHIGIWRGANNATWSASTRLTNLTGAQTSYKDSTAARDGTAWFYWAIAYGDPAENFAGESFGVVGCQNSFTVSGHTYIGDDSADTVHQIPFFNVLVPHDEGSFVRSTVDGVATGFTQPTNGASNPTRLGGVLIATSNPGGPGGDTLNLLNDDPIGGTGMNVFPNGGATHNGEADGFQLFDNQSQVWFLANPDGPGAAWGNGLGAVPWGRATGTTITAKLSYVAPFSGASFPAPGGQGGGSGSPDIPPPGGFPLLPIGSGLPSAGPNPQPTPLPAIPCCTTAMGCGCIDAKAKMTGEGATAMLVSEQLSALGL